MTGGEVIFEVHNTWTQIHGGDEFILRKLDFESQYPTEVALAQHGGFRSPEGTWDGWIRLLRRPKTQPAYFPTGLYPRLERVCRRMRYPVAVDDRRQRPGEGFPELEVHIPLRDYQKAAVEAGVLAGRGVFDCPPRSGKTRLACELQRQIALPTLWIAPTDRIVDQTTRVIESFFGKHYVTHLVGTRGQEAAGHYHVVCCTAATAVSLSQEFYLTRQMLLVDEFHHGGAKSYREIFKLCDHIYYRYGMTGTFYRSGYDTLAMHALLSNTIFKVTSDELLRRGYLVPTRVAFVPVPKNPKLRGVDSSFQIGHGKHGIHEHKVRNHLATQAVVTLHRAGRKVLILVGTKRQGYELQRMISAFLPKEPDHRYARVEFVSTDVQRPKQRAILESYLNPEDGVEVLIGTSLLGEGVDLPEVDALVYARGEKAEVSLMQNAYRVCTAIPGKRDAVIVDFADRHHRKLREHSLARLEVYYNEPTFDVSVLSSPEELVSFLGVANGVVLH